MPNPLLLLFFLAFASAADYEELYEKLKKLQSENAGESTWELGYNEYFRGKSFEEMRALLGAKLPDRKSGMKVKKGVINDNLPENFDLRERWPKCKWMRFIRDQAACGSCWAVSAASAMSDRHCIASNYKLQPYVSDQNIVSCCTSCGFGCQGGWPDRAWEYWKTRGVPTGGYYGSTFGCQPYLIQPHAPSKPTPPCSRNCIPEYQRTVEKSKLYGKESYLVQNSEDAIKQELHDSGPVVATFAVYEDFFNYKKGVYQHGSGGLVGYHAVKMVGWGVEDNGIPYWLIANSWNTTWGNKGMFKILRGSDECGIESGISAGLPKLN